MMNMQKLYYLSIGAAGCYALCVLSSLARGTVHQCMDAAYARLLSTLSLKKHYQKLQI